jgi:NADH-quinone oxidoreductase subunit J
VFSTLHFSLLLSVTVVPLIMDLGFPLLSIVFGLSVILHRNPMHALLSLIGVFLATVLFYLGNGAAFTGLVFLIVYVGAIAILFLFVVMLLNVKSLTTKHTLMHARSQ